METTLARSCCIAWLAQDDVAHARRDLDRRAWSPPEGGYHLQHWFFAFAHAQIDLYNEKPELALERAEGSFAGLKRSFLLRIEHTRVEALYRRS